MLKTSHYGKGRVRLVKVERDGDLHHFREVTVHIRFTGDYDDCYITGDNGRILPTDTMKNTVYALARKQPLGPIEEFGARLCRHFLENNPHLHSVTVQLEESHWSRLGNHSFQKARELRTATVTAARNEAESYTAGIQDLILLNTTNSSFEGYIHDPYTTLKEASDRILGTAIEATWRYSGENLSFDRLWNGLRAKLIEVFIAHISPSVQSTLYAMGEAALAGFPDVSEISLTLPNKHCLLVNLEPFGLDNPGEVFLPVDEPYGLIEATLVRTK